MHNFRPWQKHLQSLKKFGIKLSEELRSQAKTTKLKKGKMLKKKMSG